MIWRWRYECAETIITCKVCVDKGKLSKVILGETGAFLYDANQSVEFGESDVMASKFRNLEKKIKYHLEWQGHIDNVKMIDEKEQKDAAYTVTNIVISMAIGRTCYHSYNKGRQFADFENLLFLQQLNGISIGNINNGQNFARNFLPLVAKVVQVRVNKFISLPLVQTGHRPPLNISAD